MFLSSSSRGPCGSLWQMIHFPGLHVRNPKTSANGKKRVSECVLVLAALKLSALEAIYDFQGGILTND